MSTAIVITSDHDRTATGSLLLAGIVLATLTEAIASTVLSLGRNDMIGDIHATPDEFAWLDIGYTALKLIGFMVAPWLMTRVDPRRLIIGATLLMGAACGIATITARLDLLIALRIIQGFSGGTLLVGGQAIIFLAYHYRASRCFKPCLRWDRLSLPRPSHRLSRDGWSTAGPGHGFSSALFRWPWRVPDSC